MRASGACSRERDGCNMLAHRRDNSCVRVGVRQLGGWCLSDHRIRGFCTCLDLYKTSHTRPWALWRDGAKSGQMRIKLRAKLAACTTRMMKRICMFVVLALNRFWMVFDVEGVLVFGLQLQWLA